MQAEGAPGAWLAAEFAGGLARVLESMTGEAPAVDYDVHAIPEAGSTPGEEGPLWWEQPLSLSAESMVWVGANHAAWDGIGGRVLRSAGVEEVDAESARGTYLEIVTQTMSGIASALSARVGREIACGAGKEAAPVPGVHAAGFSFRIVFNDSTLELLAAFHHTLADPVEEPTAKPGPPAAAAPSAPAPQPPNSMDLLLDVELPVSISFGRAQLPLKDVIKLTTGSIVELNRSVSEPVEVIVNNCVIARGEVVVVEGNYGIRIKQVISRQERLRTLN